MMTGIAGNDDEQKKPFSAKYVTCRYEKTVLIIASIGDDYQ
jgi:hypothetical protein